MGEGGLRMEESNFRGGKDNLLLVGGKLLGELFTGLSILKSENR